MSQDRPPFQTIRENLNPVSDCNGCNLARWKLEHSDKLLVLADKTHPGSVDVYVFDAPPVEGQGEKVEHDGRSVAQIAWLMNPGHACGRAS